MTADPGQFVDLAPWHGEWEDDDPFAELKAEVSAYGHLDPLATLENLSAASGIPVGALARYVLARWASGGSEALLHLGVSGVDHLVGIVDRAEQVGTPEARREAYAALRDVVGWLGAGLDPPPEGNEG